MIIVVDCRRRRIWEFGIPTLLNFHSSRLAIKVKYDPPRRAINHPCAVGEGGNVCEGQTGEIRVRRGASSLQKAKIASVRQGECGWESVWRKEE
ncbi:hypothetical protein AVEN_101632-1 [Araneus ventricosus]|uniref:Uncharacterized protein n=1 Tax=Araneus ventricosus TaxID=182803 RepID=A0A4Y2EVP2_ARAVE|nr:hypothetical protein AVEN_101632-1 [Araneus ventricosus]